MSLTIACNVDTISAITIAQQDGLISGPSKWAEHYSGRALKQLLNNNEPDKFYKYILAWLKDEDTLCELSQGQIKALREGRITEEQRTYINDTIAFLIAKLNEIIDEAYEARLDGKAPPRIKEQLRAHINRRKQLTALIKKINAVKDVYTAQSIVRALTDVFKKGWAKPRLCSAWAYTDKKKLIICQRSVSPSEPTVKSTPKKPRAPRQPKASKTKKPKANQSSLPLHERPQEARKCTSVTRRGQHIIRGSDGVPAVDGWCNNHQIWDYCALPKSQCSDKHQCSRCFQQGHGRRSCPLN